MTALEFWESASDDVRMRIALRCSPVPTVEEIYQPFWKLPVVLKGMIYQSHEFMSTADETRGDWGELEAYGYGRR